MSVAHSLASTLANAGIEHGRPMADSLAQHFIAAGFAWLRETKGPEACATLADQLAQDFCNDVIAQNRRPA